MAVIPLLLLPACATIPVERAEEICLQDLRYPPRPQGRVGIGIGTGGHVGVGVGISVPIDTAPARTPSEAFAACVIRKSGVPPLRPLSQQPGWAQ